MKILLDTHILLWGLTEDDKLPSEAVKIIKDEENVIFYSVISIWETAIKHIRHPEKLKVSPRELKTYCVQADFVELPLDVKHIYELETLSRSEDAPPHKDPFDQILIAQAKAEGMKFLTHDELLAFYNEPCVNFV